MTELERYYGKFNEDHRLTTRHGRVEFTTTMKYIHDHIPCGKTVRIVDIGAGTGRYSVALSQEGHFVTAVEPVRRNLAALEAKRSPVNCWQGDARNLGFLEDGAFDIALLLGPLYHLRTQEDMLAAFSEARRVTKSGGIIFAAYIMNEYSILTYCFKQRHIQDVMQGGRITADFHTVPAEDDLYTYLRVEDIDALNARSGLKRVKLIAADGAADYMRRELNALTEEEFSLFLQYHLSTCERPELVGASSHVVDILRNEKCDGKQNSECLKRASPNGLHLSFSAHQQQNSNSGLTHTE